MVDLTHCEQRVQETFEYLLLLHNSKKFKVDFILSKAWESYWRRIELKN